MNILVSINTTFLLYANGVYYQDGFFVRNKKILYLIDEHRTFDIKGRHGVHPPLWVEHPWTMR